MGAAALRSVVIAAVSVAIAWTADAEAPRFRYERVVTPGARGANRLRLDATVLAGARPLVHAGEGGVSGLEDLRLFDADGREVGYLLVPPAAPSERWQLGTLLPIAPTETSSGFEVDLGSTIRSDGVRVAGIPGPFLKRLRVEGGGDRAHWTILSEAATLFDLPAERLQRTEVAYGPTDVRYLRVTWDDRNSAVVPMPQSVAAHAVTPTAASEPLRVAIGFERRPSEPGMSRFRLHLPGSHLPIVAFNLDCGGQHLHRTARVSEAQLSGGEALQVVLGTHTLQRAVRGELAAADLRIPVARPNGAELELVVDDGDNPSLELRAIDAELAPLPWIFFESADGAALTARYGDATLSPARYDVEALRESVANATVEEARWGEARDMRSPPIRPQDDAVADARAQMGAAMDISEFGYRRVIDAGPAGLTALVLDAGALAHSRALADLRIAATDGRQVPYLTESLGEPLVVELAELETIRDATNPPQRHESRYRLRLPYEGLPAARLVLSTPARVFDRTVRVGVERPAQDARATARVEEVASVHWRHADTEERSADLAIALPSLTTAEAVLIIDEGDNSALPLDRPRLLLPAYRLRFFRPDDRELTLLYGAAKVGPPRYDLALLAPRVLSAAAHEVQALPEAVTKSGPPERMVTQTKLFWAALTLAIVVLLALIARLLSKG